MSSKRGDRLQTFLRFREEHGITVIFSDKTHIWTETDPTQNGIIAASLPKDEKHLFKIKKSAFVHCF